MTLEFDADRMRGSLEELDDAHHEAMRTMSTDIHELHAETRKALGGTSRRQFLIRAGIASTAITIGSQVLPMSSLWSPAFGQGLTDADIAAYAASVEYAAVAAYKAAAASGKVKTPDVGAAATLFASQHKEHGDAFAAASGGKIAKDTVNETLVGAIGGQISAAADEKAILKIAYDVENAAAATYQFALGALKDAGARKLTASILPIEAGHAAVLGLVLGYDPAKNLDWLPKFQTETGALAPDKNPIKK
jgi:rubrerythrin